MFLVMVLEITNEVCDGIGTCLTADVSIDARARIVYLSYSCRLVVLSDGSDWIARSESLMYGSVLLLLFIHINITCDDMR